jgi:Phage Terminase
VTALDDAFALLGALVQEDGHRWGEVATEVQRADALAILDVDRPQRRHWLSRSRGYSKTTDVAAMTVAAILTQAPASARLYAAASDRDQARLLTDALAGFVHRTPELRGGLAVNNYAVNGPHGAVLEVLAADAASAYGLRPWWLVFDEMCQWPETANATKFYEALSTALPKVPEARSVIITSPGSPAHWSRKVFDTAKAEQELWRVSEVHGPPPWIPQKLIDAERRRLPDSAFRRYWMAEWAASEDQVFRPEDLAACTVLDGPQPPRAGNKYVLTVDLGWRNDRTVLAVAHRERNREGDVTGVVLDHLDVFQGSRAQEVDLEAVEDRIAHLAKHYRGAQVWCDPAQAIAMMQRLRRRGIPVEEHQFTAASNTQLALRLLELVREHRLSLPADEELLDEFAHVRLVERGPGVFRLDHAEGRHDDRVVAIGMAAVHLEDASASGAFMAAVLDRQAGGRRVDAARHSPSWHPGDVGDLAPVPSFLEPPELDHFAPTPSRGELPVTRSR